MSDWIVNACTELHVNKVKIDVLNKCIEPKEVEIKPLIYNISELNGIISKSLKHAGYDDKYITQAYFEIDLIEDRCIKCVAILIAENGKTFCSKDYFEKSHEVFKAINLSVWEKLKNRNVNLYYKIKFEIYDRFYRKLKYTKRSENRMK